VKRKGKERKTNEPAKKVQAIIPKYANQQTRKQKKYKKSDPAENPLMKKP